MPPGGAPSPQTMSPLVAAQLRAMLQARMARQGQGAPGSGAMAPQPAQGAPGGVNPAAMAAFARGAAPGMQGSQAQGPQQLAQKGRFGDTLVAHLTPGEIEVPPQVQTPRVLADLRKAFTKAGVNPQQFTAGSPQSSVNPQTGMPEYNFLSALLPTLLGGAAAFLAPEALPFLGAAAAPVGGAVGSMAGSALGGGNSNQILMSGLGGAAGGYLMGGGGIGAPGVDPTSAINSAGTSATAALPGTAEGVPALNAVNIPASAGTSATAALPGTAGGTSFMGMPMSTFAKGAIGAGLGGGIGSYMGQSPNTQAPNYPPGFNSPLPPLNPQFGQKLGSNQANRPTFTGYDPIASVTGGHPYNFFPVTQ